MQINSRDLSIHAVSFPGLALQEPTRPWGKVDRNYTLDVTWTSGTERTWIVGNTF